MLSGGKGASVSKIPPTYVSDIYTGINISVITNIGQYTSIAD